MRYLRILIKVGLNLPLDFDKSNIIEQFHQISISEFFQIACDKIMKCSYNKCFKSGIESNLIEEILKCPLYKLKSRQNFIFLDPPYIMEKKNRINQSFHKETEQNIEKKENGTLNLCDIGFYLTIFEPCFDITPLLPILISDVIKFQLKNKNIQPTSIKYIQQPFKNEKPCNFKWCDVIHINYQDTFDISFRNFENLTFQDSTNNKEYLIFIKGKRTPSISSFENLLKFFKNQLQSFQIDINIPSNCFSVRKEIEVQLYPQEQTWSCKITVRSYKNLKDIFALLQIIRIFVPLPSNIPFISVKSKICKE